MKKSKTKVKSKISVETKILLSTIMLLAGMGFIISANSFTTVGPEIYKNSIKENQKIVDYYNKRIVKIVDHNNKTGSNVSKPREAMECGSPVQVSGQIELLQGVNYFSIPVELEDPDILNFVQPLINSGVLEEIIDEEGRRVLNMMGNWVNEIGDIKPGKGYQISLNSNAILDYSGTEINLPYTVELKKGWNLIGTTALVPIDAMEIFQPLMDQGIFLKAFDEVGAQIIHFMGNWVNGIGTLKPGEGYYVQLSEDASIIFDAESPYINTGFQITNFLSDTFSFYSYNNSCDNNSDGIPSSFVGFSSLNPDNEYEFTIIDNDLLNIISTSPDLSESDINNIPFYIYQNNQIDTPDRQ